MPIVWILILIASVAVYVFLMAWVFPRTFLKTEFVAVESHDRGLKNIKETVGRSIVYQPSKQNRKYVPQYVISDRKDKKVLICKTAPNVRYIDYDVVMFNRFNQAFKVVNAKELIERERTEKLELDENTAYISLVINAVNEETFKNKVVKPVAGGKISLYALTCALMTALEVFLIKLCCSYSFGGVFQEEFVLSGKSLLFTGICAAVAAIINVACVLIVVLKRNHSAEKGDK